MKIYQLVRFDYNSLANFHEDSLIVNTEGYFSDYSKLKEYISSLQIKHYLGYSGRDMSVFPKFNVKQITVDEKSEAKG